MMCLMSSDDSLYIFIGFILTALYIGYYLLWAKDVKNPAYVEAMKGFDVWPEGPFVITPLNGIVVLRLAWFIFRAWHPSVRNVLYVLSVIFHNAFATLFVAHVFCRIIA